jgi:hypothetical protein
MQGAHNRSNIAKIKVTAAAKDAGKVIKIKHLK